MIFASTDGTKSTLIGCSGVPISDAGASVATGASVGASVAGASVTTGACVAAGPQALRIMEVTTIRANRTNEKRFFMFSPLKRTIRWTGQLPERHDGNTKQKHEQATFGLFMFF